MSDPQHSAALASLLRWEASGATWRVCALAADSAAVELLSCDAGEVMGRLDSAEPDFVAYVRRAESGEPA